MKKSVVCVLLCAIILISGCNTDSDRIKIGLVLALTGDLSSYGVAIKEGVELAMDEVDTTRFELVFMDSKGNSKDAVSSLYSLINIHDVRYIIGDVSSSTTLSMIPIIERADIFLLSPGAATPQLTNISKLFARNYPSSADESIKSASYMLNNITRECVAVIHSNDDYGIGLSKVFSEYYIEEGGDICFRESYETGTKNFRDILARLSQLNFKAVYLSGNQKEMGAFIRQYREYGFNQKVIANMAFLEDDCIKVAGDAAEGVIIPIVKYDIDDNSLFLITLRINITLFQHWLML